MLTWTPTSTAPARSGFYAIRFSWRTVPAIAFFSPTHGWRDSGRTLHGVEAWFELPPYDRGNDGRQAAPPLAD